MAIPLERERDAMERVAVILRNAGDILTQVIQSGNVSGTTDTEVRACRTAAQTAFREARRAAQRIVVEQLTDAEATAEADLTAAQQALAGLP